MYALTRRGFPPSQTPASGYELVTLVADIMAFLDAKELPRVHLVGHSLAGLELTQIASHWPRRVRSLGYLDAIADPATAYAVLQKDPLGSSPAAGVVWTQISRWWNGYSVDFSGVEAPRCRLVRPKDDTLASRRMRPLGSVSEPMPTGGQPPFPRRSDGWPNFDGKCHTRE